MGVVIYAGSDRGIVAIKEQGKNDWQLNERIFLPGWEVTQLVLNGSGQLIAGTRGDGIWLQTDKSGEGRTGGWTKPNYGRPGPGKVHCVTVDPFDPDTIYVGTEPIGLYVTHDGGENWECLPGLRELPSVPEITYPVPSVEPHVRDITIDPKNRDVMYAALQVGYLAKSTDRGITWKLLTGGIDADVHTLVIPPEDPSRIYAATGGHGHRLGETVGKALYVSVDGGESWSPMATEFYQDYAVPLVMHPNDPDILFSSIANGPPQWRRPSGAEACMIASRDGGKHWQETKTPFEEIGPEFPGAITIDPANPDDVYVCTHKGHMFRSRDCGDSWERMPVDLSRVGGLNDMMIFHA
jgi:photosystem II stability/assembly factor-like uncharacterized protein